MTELAAPSTYAVSDLEMDLHLERRRTRQVPDRWSLIPADFDHVVSELETNTTLYRAFRVAGYLIAFEFRGTTIARIAPVIPRY